MKHSPELLKIPRYGAAIFIALGSLGLVHHEKTKAEPSRIQMGLVPLPEPAETLPTTTTTTIVERVVLQSASRGATRPRPAMVDAPVGCENYRSIFEQFDWPVDQAMFTADKESGCDPNSVSATNDYGIMQLHNMPIFDPQENIQAGYRKWEAGRVGDHNFSAWYAVCTAEDNPKPKYEGIDCQ